MLDYHEWAFIFERDTKLREEAVCGLANDLVHEESSLEFITPSRSVF